MQPGAGVTDLLQRVAANDPAAVRECLERYGSLVWTIARRFARDPADAEDAAQEAFVEIWSKASRYEPERASEAAFIALIVRRRLIDRARRRGARVQAEELDLERPPEAPTSALDAVDTADEARRAKDALATLRPEHRRALELSIYHGLSHEEIARALSAPLGTVKTYIRSGLARVREHLGIATSPALGSPGLGSTGEARR